MHGTCLAALPAPNQGPGPTASRTWPTLSSESESMSTEIPSPSEPALAARHPCPVAPECCDAPMAETTSGLDCEMGSWRFTCDACAYSILVHDEPDGGILGCGPTAHPAGSEGKVQVMTARANRRLPLFDPQDNRQVVTPAATGEAGGAKRRAAGSNASVGERGVNWDEKRSAYRVRVGKKGTRVHVGLFVELATAQKAAALARAGKVEEARALAGGVVKEGGKRVRGAGNGHREFRVREDDD
jgi:hypothetical protein